MNIPLPDPRPEVTDITVEQERQNNVTAAIRRVCVETYESAAAQIDLEELHPTPDEIRAAAMALKG